jgi:hypothetical protein
MKTLKQPVTTSMPTTTKSHLSKARSHKVRKKRGAESNQAIADGQTWARQTPLDPAKVEEMIQQLSDLRETLAPQVAAAIQPGQRMFVTPEPIWDVSGEIRDDGKVLLIRHPGIGWIGFIVPHDDCRRLAKKLTGNAK